MSKQNGNKGRRFDRAFKEEAVRLLQTSGRRQRQIAGDLGISVSALGRWVAELRAEDLLSGPHEGIVKLTDCRLFSAFLHEAKLLKLRNVAIRYLPRFRSESG